MRRTRRPNKWQRADEDSQRDFEAGESLVSSQRSVRAECLAGETTVRSESGCRRRYIAFTDRQFWRTGTFEAQFHTAGKMTSQQALELVTQRLLYGMSARKHKFKNKT